MLLAEYLSDQGKTKAAFARQIGESPVTIGRYVNGDRIPEEDVMRKIYTATNGQVTANDFYDLPVNGHKSNGSKNTNHKKRS